MFILIKLFFGSFMNCSNFKLQNLNKNSSQEDPIPNIWWYVFWSVNMFVFGNNLIILKVSSRHIQGYNIDVVYTTFWAEVHTNIRSQAPIFNFQHQKLCLQHQQHKQLEPSTLNTKLYIQHRIVTSAPKVVPSTNSSIYNTTMLK